MKKIIKVGMKKRKVGKKGKDERNRKGKKQVACQPLN
jgi:hypothetical protein